MNKPEMMATTATTPPTAPPTTAALSVDERWGVLEVEFGAIAAEAELLVSLVDENAVESVIDESPGDN